jgi:hypothetical protein
VLTPRTPSGRRSVGFAVGFVALMAVFFAVVATGQRGGDRFFDNLWLSVPIVGAWLSGLAAAVSGSYAVLARRERAVLVFVSASVGLLISAFGIAEVLFSH